MTSDTEVLASLYDGVSWDELAEKLDSDYEELDEESAEQICEELKNWGGAEHEVVFWLPEWLADEKGFGEQVITGICDVDTEKAWCKKNKGRGDDTWIPKSVALAFQRGVWR